MHFDAAPLPHAEIVVASGASATDVPTGIGSLMHAPMYAAAGQVLVFNLLDAVAFPEHPLLVGHRIPTRWRRSAAMLAPQVEVVRDYLENDATLALRWAFRPDDPGMQEVRRPPFHAGHLPDHFGMIFFGSSTLQYSFSAKRA